MHPAERAEAVFRLWTAVISVNNMTQMTRARNDRI